MWAARRYKHYNYFTKAHDSFNKVCHVFLLTPSLSLPLSTLSHLTPSLSFSLYPLSLPSISLSLPLSTLSPLTPSLSFSLYPPLMHLFELLPSGRRFRTIIAKTDRLRKQLLSQSHHST